MAIAWFITILAIAGIVVGALLPSRVPSTALSAVSGGLLVGIALFWLTPEAAETAGLFAAAGGLGAVAGILFVFDHFLEEADAHRRRILLPLLAATSLHSFIDGWSVRSLAVQPVANIAVPLGLALHKIPEGLALGWLAHRTSLPARLAIGGAIAVEMTTVLGAFVQPLADNSGYARFGPLWTAGVLIALAGSFVFFGLHAVFPERKNRGVLVLFLATFLMVGALARFHSGF